MVQYSVVKPMWRSKKTDLIPGFIAFIACLVLPLQIGILIGIGINMMFILYHSARPKIRLDKYVVNFSNVEYLMLTPDRCLIFPSVEFVRSIINKQKRTSNLQIVIDCSYIYAADFTAAKVIGTLLDNFQSSNQNIYFYNLKPSVAHVFEGVRIIEQVSIR
uniref:STAS domain-containing protein n=1 Tax=Megaselia scalaris TaxID=36166 RepID=T1GUR8_MEGSC